MASSSRPSVQDLFGEPGAVQPHFGTAAARDLAAQVQAWALQQAGTLSASDQPALTALQTAVADLTHRAQVTLAACRQRTLGSTDEPVSLKLRTVSAALACKQALGQLQNQRTCSQLLTCLRQLVSTILTRSLLIDPHFSRG